MKTIRCADDDAGCLSFAGKPEVRRVVMPGTSPGPQSEPTPPDDAAIQDLSLETFMAASRLMAMLEWSSHLSMASTKL